MEVKQEINHPNICRFCLSRDRMTSGVEVVLFSFGLLTEWEPPEQARVCWECRARLVTINQFKKQANIAKKILNEATSIGMVQSLSKLSYSAKATFDQCFFYEPHAPANHVDVKSEVEIDIDVFVKSVCEIATDPKADDSADFGIFVEPVCNLDENSETKDVKKESAAEVLAIENIPKKKSKKKHSDEKVKKRKETKIKKEGTEKKLKRKCNKNKRYEKPAVPKINFPKPDHYECAHCGAVFPRRLQMHWHIKIHFPSCICETCGKTFVSKRSLKVHYLTHVPVEDRPYPCTKCNRKFITKDKLNVHMLFHDGTKDIQCDQCELKFFLQSSLKWHKKQRHGFIDEKNKRPVYHRTKTKFKNPKIFATDRIKPKREPSDHSNKPKVKSHVPMEKKYECNICGKTFKLKEARNSHAVVHTGERPHKCDICDAKFKFASGLWGHKIKHTGIKPHECTVCGARFTLRGNLKGHMKIHTNEKSFECDICSHKFLWRRNLRNHMKVHTKTY